MPRRFGQHFLSSKSILDRIAEAACGERAPLVIEIGPGKGALTESLLARAGRVVAIEVDPYLVHYLQQKFREPIDQQHLTLIEGDVLKTDLAAWGPAIIAGNLPYYITSPILEKILALGENWTRAVFLVQAEVAARLVSPAGSRAFGFLSVQAQLFAHIEVLFPVMRGAFRPPPKVDSAVIRLTPRDAAAELKIADRAAFLRFASIAFRQKRKTLRNNLAPVYGKDRIDAIPEASRRAEQLTLAELAALYRVLGQAR
ncbi:MAG TPA: 16S rRNA (adenine(1518)-N(6)/adenine(1519)-N(6))-dimethyltransferase RsmA [Bryobacteraceae bacterium]|jgi:16S rRNA (adenine1518-N6/adenine1519-N6)-dimethyltransferase|nr:16S rRNA (adenine(1518)-N(6)/adenine(1519)-N(6))-dimethyltransferase RsmA [Bryobacteraceae bacterium]